MNTKRLKNLMGKNETTDNVLNFIADRQRNTVYTAFSGLRADVKKKHGKEVNRVQFDSTFEELEAIGAGKVDKSPRGVYKGFTWSIPIRTIASVLRSEPVAVEAAKPSVKDAVVSTEPKKVTLVIIRRNRKPETIETNEDQIAQISVAQPRSVAASQ